MTGGVKLMFAATTINEAVLTATEKWRVLAEDPVAKLPWSTHYEFFEEAAPLADLAPQMMCLVTVEFDRKVIDELTGAVESDPSAKAV